MSARHYGAVAGTLPNVTTSPRLIVVAEGKAAPFGGSAEPFGSKPQGGADADPVVPEEEFPEEEEVEEDVAQHEWSGDLIDPAVDTPSDPALAFSSFTGQDGEQAWLDRADDGTLTAWVQDTDGSTYRYSDVDAWAVDVDDAGMVRADGAVEGELEEPLPEDEMAVEDGSAGEGPPDFMEGKQIVLRAVVRPKV